MNIYEMKGMILTNRITAFLAEKVIDVVDICKYILTGSYAQNKEDVIVRKILIDIFHSRLEDISYLDIGANKWRHGSNTYLFYGKCKGTLVEADPVLADKLRRKRKADQIYNVAVSTKENESLKFYILSLATRSSLDKKHVEEEMKRGIKLIKTIQIKCETVNNIIAKNKNVPDFLSLDIEGMDFQVL